MKAEHGVAAVVVGDGLYDTGLPEGHKVTRIEYGDPVTDNDTGFVCYLDSTPEDRDLKAEDALICCLHCLIDHQPEAGAGLDLAQKLGRGSKVQFVADGEWRDARPIN